jgi:hypothetical protein
LSSGIAAGIEQARNSYHQFGQGLEGYGKRFGADYADGVNGIITGHVLMRACPERPAPEAERGKSRLNKRYFLGGVLAGCVLGGVLMAVTFHWDKFLWWVSHGFRFQK